MTLKLRLQHAVPRARLSRQPIILQTGADSSIETGTEFRHRWDITYTYYLKGVKLETNYIPSQKKITLAE